MKKLGSFSTNIVSFSAEIASKYWINTIRAKPVWCCVEVRKKFWTNLKSSVGSGSALDGNFFKSLPFPLVSPVPFVLPAPGPVHFTVPFGTLASRS